MYHPTTRVLTVLELLQSRQRLGGQDIAERLEVDTRTVRRYIMMLQDLGIPIESVRGRHGGYRIRPGYKLPPLMFTDDEALAIVLGLLAGRRLGLAGAAADAEGALAKIERVLPTTLRERVQAVQDALKLDLVQTGTGPVNALLMELSTAVHRQHSVWIHHRAGSDGHVTEREIDPYGIVFRAGAWYAVGYCHLRAALRCFRLDRIMAVEPRESTFSPPPNFDCIDFLLRSLALTPEAWEIELLLETTIENARRWVSPALAALDPTAGGVRFQATVENLDDLAGTLATYPFLFVIRRPAELRESLRQRAAALLHAADRPIPME